MTFQFSRQHLAPGDHRLERCFEILPGAASWSMLIGLGLLSWFRPLTAAIVVIAYDLYWLLRLFYMTLFLMGSSIRLAIERDTDWLARIRAIDRLTGEPQEIRSFETVSTSRQPASLRRRVSQWMHQRRLEALRHSGQMPPASRDIRHLVIFPVAKEPREVIEPGLASLARQSFPTQQVLVVLALEARAPEDVQAGARQLQAEYRARFLDLALVVDPDGLPGEARVKGANVTYAAKAAAAQLAARGIGFERVVVSCFDADTVVSPHYLSCLTHAFMMAPDRTQASFQPIPVYHNNIWEVPGFARVLDIGSSFFQLIEAANPEQLVTFSSHSMSFKALVDVGFWPVDLISDDSAIFWKAFIHFEGRYRVVPLPVMLSMDVVAADSRWKTIANVYRQKRRWAWGVENFPLVMRAFIQARGIDLSTKIRHAFKLFEGHVSWATSAFILSLIGWVPALCAGREFSDSVVYYNAPRITATIFSLASLSLLASIVLSLCLLPKPVVGLSLLKRLGHAFEWLLVPLISVFLSALPALDAQTRLLLGRYLEFWVADKARKPPTSADATNSQNGVEAERLGDPTAAAVVATRKTAYDVS